MGIYKSTLIWIDAAGVYGWAYTVPLLDVLDGLHVSKENDANTITICTFLAVLTLPTYRYSSFLMYWKGRAVEKISQTADVFAPYADERTE